MSVSISRAKPITPADSRDRNGALPPLESGDRLTRDDFERRYDAMPHLKKAELVEGVVYVPSPVSQRHHGKPHSVLGGWLFVYQARTPGLESGDNSTVRLDLNNEPQPDCLLFVQAEHGGQVQIDELGYGNGAPDLVAEVAASSASYDLHGKLEAYQRNGVREYIVWRVYDREVDWFFLREARYERLAPGDDGILRSKVFAGLWLDPAALLSGDFAKLLDVLEQGLKSAEHADFKSDLQRAGGHPAG
jgi:Uma2 family endonuclease